MTPNYPPVIRLEPSGACNLRCRHCPTGTVEIESGILKDEVFEKTLSDITENVLKLNTVVLYHGGEPFLNKSLIEYAVKIKNAGVKKIKTITNGMLVAPRHYAGLCSGSLDIVTFSLDGMTEKENNRTRSGCDGARVIENIKGLVDYKKKTDAKKPDITIDSVQFPVPGEAGLSTTPPKPAWVMNALGDRVDEILSINSFWAMVWPYMKVNDGYDIYTDGSFVEESAHCNHVYETFTIRWNGDVVACCYDLAGIITLGNILESTISEIWHGEAFRSLRGSIMTRRFNSLCAKCNVVQPSRYLVIRDSVQSRG